ncbi:MAG: hypothetical protein ACXWND_16500 [Gemmatimonadaceae bacterium]
MAQKHLGWLFGLEGALTEPIQLPDLIVRRMTPGERDRIRARAVDFFARDSRIWENSTQRFPYVYEKHSADQLAIGGEDMVGVLFSLLSAGEVRTPIQWSELPQGGGAGASASEIVSHFFRLINSRYQPVDLTRVASSFSLGVAKLGAKMFDQAQDIFGAVVLDRLFLTKGHPISKDLVGSDDANVVARAADTAMLLEYLFHEGSTTEIGFRLGMSVAWVLGTTPADRESILSTLKETYAMRSRRVHGAKSTTKPIKAEAVSSVINADTLLRRTILTRVLNDFDDDTWRNFFISARLGRTTELFDDASWASE